jgi:nucleotidyltransferase/DNA polymerase involved in DNA repair
MNSIIAHVDCVSFYCSVERVFHAALRERPIIVLSANDGCVVAVSPEAKALGITRGTPVFGIQSLIEKHQIATFSSNFVLYQDVSNRIMDVLFRFATQGRREIASIDEAFLAKSAAKLQIRKISTAKDLRDADPFWIRRFLYVVGERMVWELRGVVCQPLELTPKPKKHLSVAHTFGRPIEKEEELSEALCHYLAKATEKLRQQQSVARFVSIFIHTNPFAKDMPEYATSTSGHLLFPSAFPPDFFPLIKDLLARIFQPGYRYKRAGVFLSELRPETVVQHDLFGDFSLSEYERNCLLMQEVDRLNRLLGHDSVIFAAQGITREWQAKPRFLSRRFTTQWRELLTVR